MAVPKRTMSSRLLTTVRAGLFKALTATDRRPD